jgi:hypothetical protein
MQLEIQCLILIDLIITQSQASLHYILIQEAN